MSSMILETQTMMRPQRREQHREEREPSINVGNMERMASLIGGGILALAGLRRGDLAGLAIAAVGGSLAYRGMTGHCNLYSSMGISTAEKHGPATSIPAGQGYKIEESVTINKPRAELFQFWRNFENLPRIMPYLESVHCHGDHSHWVAKGPFGNVEWEAEIHTERENELIGWRSREGSQVDTAGSVHFQDAPGNRGTEVRVVMKYNPPAGKFGANVAWLLGRDAESEVRESLRAFKQMMETGSVPTTQGQPRGRCR